MNLPLEHPWNLEFLLCKSKLLSPESPNGLSSKGPPRSSRSFPVQGMVDAPWIPLIAILTQIVACFVCLERAFPQLFWVSQSIVISIFQVNSSICDCYNLKIPDSAAAIKTKAPVNVIVCGKLTVILTRDDH